VGAIILQWQHRCNRAGMIVPDLHDGFEGAGVGDPGSWMPVHTIDLEFLADKVVGVANDDAICCRI
jgi:hypothetical protein